MVFKISEYMMPHENALKSNICFAFNSLMSENSQKFDEQILIQQIMFFSGGSVYFNILNSEENKK